MSDSEVDEVKTLELDGAQFKPPNNSLVSSNCSSEIYNESNSSKTEFFTALTNDESVKTTSFAQEPEKDLGYRL